VHRGYGKGASDHWGDERRERDTAGCVIGERELIKEILQQGQGGKRVVTTRVWGNRRHGWRVREDEAGLRVIAREKQEAPIRSHGGGRDHADDCRKTPFTMAMEDDLGDGSRRIDEALGIPTSIDFAPTRRAAQQVQHVGQLDRHELCHFGAPAICGIHLLQD
jgi:hypothetical protein